MTKKILPLALALFFSSVFPVHAQEIPSAGTALSPAQKLEIQSLVREYILEHGDVLIEGVTKFQSKQEEEANKKSGEKAKEIVASVAPGEKAAMAGNPKGDITIVEFFDYQCGYCKKAFTEIQSILEKDKNVRIFFYDMPVLGEASHEAALWSLAAQEQGKYFDFHKVLIQHQGEFNAETLKKLATEAGLDAEALEKAKADPKISAVLEKNIQTARELNVQGTPAFIIENEVFRGYIPEDVMLQTIKTQREAKSGAAQKDSGKESVKK